MFIKIELIKKLSWNNIFYYTRLAQYSRKFSYTSSDRPKPTFEPKPKLPKFRFDWAKTETETES